MRNIAFVAGTQVYSDPKLEDLPSVENDIKSMKTVLTSNCACADGEIFSYISFTEQDKPLTAASMLRIIREKGSVFAQGDVDILFFYYSGHGFLANNKSHLYFSDSIPGETVGALSIDKLEEALLDLKIAKHIVIILDTCQSEPRKKGSVSLKIKGSVSANPTGTIVFYSCSPHQNSYMAGDGSIYTKVLVRILGNKESLFTVKDISAELKKQIESYAKAQGFGAEFQVPHTSISDASWGEIEIKQRSDDRSTTTNTMAATKITLNPMNNLPWINHKEQIFKVYFSVNIHSSQETMKMMQDAVLGQGDLPILYGHNIKDSRSWVGQIDDSDFVVILLNNTLKNTQMLKKGEYERYLDEAPNGTSGGVPPFVLEFYYALRRQKPILLLYCIEEFGMTGNPSSDKRDCAAYVPEFVQSVYRKKIPNKSLDIREIPSNNAFDKSTFEALYFQFKTSFSHLLLGYVSAEKDKLLQILNRCIQLNCETQTVGSYVVSSNEMERTSCGDEFHVLTNDLLNYDFTPVSSLTIATNTQKGVHYYYYGPHALQSDVNSFKENIKKYYRKSFKARRLIVQWIRLQKSKEFDYTEFLTLICNNTVKSYIETLVNDIGQKSGTVDSLVKVSESYDPRCMEKDYLKKININKLTRWIRGESFASESDIYDDIKKLNALRIPFVESYETWGKFVNIRDFCCKIERLINMSQLTQWQASSDRHNRRSTSFSISPEDISRLIDYFKYTGDDQAEKNRVITDVIERWMVPKEGEILCGEDQVSEEDMEEYLSRIHFCQLEDKKPYILAYSFCLFVCEEGPGTAWYTTYAKTDSRTPNTIALDNDLMMVELDSDSRIRSDLEVAFSRLITQSDNILYELKREHSRILRRLGIDSV